MDILITAALSVALLTASFTDIKSQRVYNWLTFPLILSGLAVHTVFGGLAGFKFSAAGFGLGFAFLAIPYFIGVMGAGDVKLMAGVGAWLGAMSTAMAFLFTCLAGGLYALGVLAMQPDRCKAVFGNIANTFVVLVATRQFNFAPVSSEKALPRLCYGVAIAVGTAVAMGLSVWQSGSIHSGY